MSDIIPLRAPTTDAPEELMMLCPECDGGSFIVLLVDKQSTFECTLCGVQLEDDMTAVACKPPTVIETPTSIRLQNASGGPLDETLAMRRMLNHVTYDNTVAFVIFNADGVVHSWGRVPRTDAERDWFIERVDGLYGTFHLEPEDHPEDHDQDDL